MSITVGTGDYKYELVENWAKLPDGWVFTQVGAVAVDSSDRVYVFNRSEYPVIVFDPDGNFINSWGEGHFSSAHGICFAADETMWLADSEDHTVKHFTKSGEHIRTVGAVGSPAGDGQPFNRPTDITVAPNGDLYVSDGWQFKGTCLFQRRRLQEVLGIDSRDSRSP